MTMKRWICTMLAVLLLAAGCGADPGGVSLPEDPSSPPPVQSPESGEPQRDASAFYDQPDPTLPENGQGQRIRWDHVEFLVFGDPAAYQEVTIEVLNQDTDADPIRLSIRVPQQVILDSVMDFDGGFAGGTLKIGGHPSHYYKLKEGETPFENEAYNLESFSGHPLSGEKYQMVETRDNVVGGYVTADRFLRAIGGLNSENNIVQYVVDLGDGMVTHLYFYVSKTAAAEDLELYDAIVCSIARQP